MAKLNDRIKKLRKELDLTQREFGERIGIKGNTIAQYELGRNEPIDAVISLICREFGVNENWLRDGTGEMFIKLSRNEELAKLTRGLLDEKDNSFKNRLISVLANLTEEQWITLEQKVKEIAGYEEKD